MVEYQPSAACCGVRPKYRLLDQAMHDHFAACEGGTPEATLIDWAWQQFGKQDGLFLDIGCHVGSWTLPFALAGMNVVAFEPNPVIHNLVSQARLDNGLAFDILNVGISDHEGEATLTAPGPDGGMASIVIDYGAHLSRQVPITSLDRYAFAPDLVKIDVEGAEVDVLRGARDTIERCRPVILFECWEDERGQRIEQLFGHVASIGYDCTRTAWPEMWLATPCS